MQWRHDNIVVCQRGGVSNKPLGQRQDTGPGILWSVHRWTRPIGEPPTCGANQDSTGFYCVSRRQMTGNTKSIWCSLKRNMIPHHVHSGSHFAYFFLNYRRFQWSFNLLHEACKTIMTGSIKWRDLGPHNSKETKNIFQDGNVSFSCQSLQVEHLLSITNYLEVRYIGFIFVTFFLSVLKIISIII